MTIDHEHRPNQDMTTYHDPGNDHRHTQDMTTDQEAGDDHRPSR